MTKSKATKIAIQLLVVILFIFITSVALFYAFGYRYDYQKSTVVSTGIIRIPQQITTAEILVNNEIINNSTPLNISALNPGNYTLEIRKKNYHPWEKTIKVEAGKISEVNGINLIPIKTKGFDHPIPNTSHAFKQIFAHSNLFGYLNPNNVVSIFSVSSLNEPLKTSFDINFNDDQSIVPLDSGKLLINSNDTHYQYFNLSQKSLENSFILPSNAHHLRVIGNDGFYVSNNNLFHFSLPAPLFDSQTKKITGELYHSNITEFEIIDLKNKIFSIKRNNDRFFLTQFITSKNTPKVIDSNIIKIPQLSPNKNIIAYQKINELWTYNITTQKKSFITRFSEPISNLKWHPTADQVLFIQNKQLKICDTAFENCYQLADADEDSPLFIFQNSNQALFKKNNILHTIDIIFNNS